MCWWCAKPFCTRAEDKGLHQSCAQSRTVKTWWNCLVPENFLSAGHTALLPRWQGPVSHCPICLRPTDASTVTPLANSSTPQPKPSNLKAQPSLNKTRARQLQLQHKRALGTPSPMPQQTASLPHCLCRASAAMTAGNSSGQRPPAQVPRRPAVAPAAHCCACCDTAATLLASAALLKAAQALSHQQPC